MKLNSSVDDYFCKKEVVKQLGHRAVRGGAATITAQLATFGIQMISTIVLARLLTPEDYGLIAMILAVTSFLIPFKDFGLSTATLQRTQISPGQITNLFWINVAICSGITVALGCFAPLISKFYSEPVLTLTTLVFSVKFFFEGLSIQHEALLKRQIQFGAVSLLQVSALVISAALAIFGAWVGMGHWSLVIQQVTLPVIIALGVWIISPWRPGLPSRNQGARSMISFGSKVTASHILSTMSRNVDNVLIGWYWGAGALGLYSKAYSLLVLPLKQINNPLNHVAVAVLSRLQNEPDRYREVYCRMITLLAYATTPLLITLAVLSRDIIIVVLGHQWIQSAPIFTILAIAGIGQPVVATVGWVYISLGQADRLVRWTSISTPITIVSFLIGLPWGPVGVATTYAVTNQLLRYPTLWYAFRYAPITIRDFLQAVWRPFVVSGVMFLAMMASRHYLNGYAPLERLVICCLAGGTALFCSIMFWPETRRQMLYLIRTIESLWREKLVA